MLGADATRIRSGRGGTPLGGLLDWRFPAAPRVDVLALRVYRALAVLVTSLLGRAQVDTAALCLRSLAAYCADGARFRLHDDGTLGAADAERLEELLGSVEVIWRADADEQMHALLARRPETAAWRRANPLALKLADALLLGGEESLVFCDTDVLFLRPFSAGALALGDGLDAVFMADTQSAYSMRSWQALATPRVRLLRRVNTGLFAVRRAVWDPDLVEWFASRRDLHRTPVWAEQTCWALLGARGRTHLLDERRVVVPRCDGAPGPEVVAAHFVRSVRHRLAGVAAAAPDRRGEAPVELASSPARPCRAHHLLADELRRRLEARRAG